MEQNWKDKAVAVRKGEELDKVALKQYFDEHLPQFSGDLNIKQFPGGASNLTYAVDIGDKRLVLRRPPFGPKIKSAHDMSREYKLFSSLIDSYSKVPKPLLFCEDESIIGREFYVMERVEGVILRAGMPNEMHPNPELMNKIAHSLVETMVELHQVDYEAVGLGNLGKPKGYNERQVTGWTKRYFNAKTDEVPEIEKVSYWLANNLLPESDSCLIHNDYKYDNVVLDSSDWSKIIAILDWEMCTLGDPLMDLGTSLCYWTNPNDPDWIKKISLSPTTLPGNPTRGEIAEIYAKISGRNLDNIIYCYVFGLFKIAVVIQQIYKRYKTGHSTNPKFAHMNHAVKGLSVMAWQAVQKNRMEDLF
ncbi:MAG: phosphotransferase family protein [Bacteroidota bacterium]